MHQWLTEEDENNETWLMCVLTRSITRIYDRRAKEIGLSQAQWQVLVCLKRFPGMSQKTLADLLDVPPITLMRYVDGLEKGGWVVRKLDRDDRRLRRLFLTESAITVIGRLTELGMELRQEAFVDFTQKEHQLFMQTLRKIEHNLREKNKEIDEPELR
jgi:MarR family transcriptional regulator for hemolysin